MVFDKGTHWTEARENNTHKFPLMVAALVGGFFSLSDFRPRNFNGLGAVRYVKARSLQG